MSADINRVIDAIKDTNNSVDSLMGLVDGGNLNKETLWELAEIWDQITAIPFEYARFIVDDDLERLVRTVSRDYNNAYSLGNYLEALFLHKSNRWLSQIIGAEKYQLIDGIFDRYAEELLTGQIPDIFNNVASYEQLLENAAGLALDISNIIRRAEEARSQGDYKNMYGLLTEGLKEEPDNYELYYSLGEYYLENDSRPNINQAHLCFENALNHCNNKDDTSVINNTIDSIKSMSDIKRVAIIIVSYNLNYMLQKNIERIRETLPLNSYQIIVVDNASTDGVYEWLQTQDDILLIRNESNRGFGIACNQGVELLNTYDEEFDIFLLNNDTRLADNSLFWLRMGLYEDDYVGATGSLSNYAGNEQQLELDFSTPGDYLEYGRKNNIIIDKPYEERVRLSGFAMLIRSDLWEKTGGMDKAFAPGYYEDDDLCMKIRRAGYRLILCNNSFIYHAGSQSFSKLDGIEALLENNYKKFIDKYGFPINEYAYPDKHLADALKGSVKGENVLIYGNGLGANMTYLKSNYPELNYYGIENDDSLLEFTCLPNNCIKSLDELDRELCFDYVFINRDFVTDAELLMQEFGAYIRTGSKLISYYPGKKETEEICYYNFNKIKLIIWDLDDTFWKGTISEERVLPIQENIDLIKSLLDHGIVNSISSKNDRAVAFERLADMGVADDFVFADINWEGKGSQIADKLKAMRLRAENTLFIDDNVANLKEASYFAEGIMTAEPGIIPKLIEYYAGLEPSDTEHKRLIQYKVMEEKNKMEAGFSSRDEFLNYSNIRVDICDDCIGQLDRITEMIMRTNQLNYTKNRMDREDILRLLENPDYKNAYISARDRFGEHGIIGFYCLDTKNNKLIHFLFSCRVMGMGVEQYVYNQLGCPTLKIEGQVAIELEAGKETPWINNSQGTLSYAKAKTSSDKGSKILLKGPCDLATMENFIKSENISREFNYVNDKGVITAGQNHSVHIMESIEMAEEEIQSLILSGPIVCRGDFETDIFNPTYDYICYSLLPDCHSGLYRNKETGAFLAFGSRNYDITNPDNWNNLIMGKIVNHAYPFNRQMLTEFAARWEYIGSTPVDMLINNLSQIYKRLNKSTRLILIFGSEIESEEKNEEFANHAPRHALVNRAVEEFAKDRDRVYLVNPSKYIKSQDDFAGCTNHYSRNVYYNMAEEINELLDII